MIAYAARRLVWALLTAFAASIVAFLLFWSIPNVDPAYFLGGAEHGTNETRARATEVYGLDDPLPVQYVRLMKEILNGNVECFYGCGSLRSAFAVAFEQNCQPSVMSSIVGFLLGSESAALEEATSMAWAMGVKLPLVGGGLPRAEMIALAFPGPGCTSVVPGEHWFGFGKRWSPRSILYW